MSVDDKYTYPGSGGVLVNAKGIRDKAGLDGAMNDYASVAMAELRLEGAPPSVGFDYLRSIHSRLFEKIVPNIAGRMRDVDAGALGTGIPYCRPEFIEPMLTTLFTQLEREDFLTGLDSDTFAVQLADRWGDLSAIHPFRDGNTRSQSFYITVLAERAGHPVDWQHVNVDELRERRLTAVTGNSTPLAEYLAPRLLTRDSPRQTPTLQTSENQQRSTKPGRSGSNSAPTDSKPRRSLRDQIGDAAGRLKAQNDALPRPTQHDRRHRGPTR